ncbi:hypothetical protein U3516DRAFT_769897 [Neocallimastix sp. 'constans']
MYVFMEFYTTSTPKVDLLLIISAYSPRTDTYSTLQSVSSYCFNTLIVVSVRDSYSKYPSIKRTEAVPLIK